jgi:extradiol dioxygenase family protein
MNAVFHLAIPTHDLDAAEDFYVRVLGAARARRYDDRVTFNFFNHQVVCHLAPQEIDREVKMYPRHFGMTFVDHAEFDRVHARAKATGWPFFKELSVRWPEKAERHEMFFLCDPSNNLIEFKHYAEPRFIY